MQKKKGLALIFLFAALCTMSIGFASWNFVIKTEATGGITVDDVINTNDYISFDTTKGDNNDGISMFKYYDSCFVDAAKAKSLTGHISVYLTIDLDNCKQIFNLVGQDSIRLEYTILYQSGVATSLNAFSSTYLTHVYCIYNSVTNTLAEEQISRNATNAQCTYVLGDVLNGSGTLSVELKYEFTVSDLNASSFFTAVRSDHIAFSFSLKLEGVSN